MTIRVFEVGAGFVTPAGEPVSMLGTYSAPAAAPFETLDAALRHVAVTRERVLRSASGNVVVPVFDVFDGDTKLGIIGLSGEYTPED